MGEALRDDSNIVTAAEETKVVYHLPKKSGHFGRNVNGNGNFHGKTEFLER